MLIEKRSKIKPKASRWKEVIKILAETNEIENTIEKINETKSWFFEKHRTEGPLQPCLAVGTAVLSTVRTPVGCGFDFSSGHTPAWSEHIQEATDDLSLSLSLSLSHTHTHTHTHSVSRSLSHSLTYPTLG